MAELLTFMKSVPGSHVTVNDICDHFEKESISVGMMTVYRHLERMVKQGVYVGEQDDSEPSIATITNTRNAAG